MKIRVKHIEKLKYSLILIVLLFALAPCSVKRVLYQKIDIEKIENLNKTKTTIVAYSSCSTVDFLSVNKKINLKAAVTFLPVFNSSYLQNSYYPLIEKKFDTKENDSKLEDNFPPKYILFKRLKLDTV